MLTIVKPVGRLGNQIIRAIAVSMIAEKIDIRVHYSSHYAIQQLGIPLYSGKKTYQTTVELTNENYSTLYETPPLANLDPSELFFQTEMITQKIKAYLNKHQYSIMNKNPFQKRYADNCDAFIHVRLGDVAQYNPGLSYYKKAIEECGPLNNIYISTDESSHPIIQELVKYRNAILLTYDEIKTLQFGSTCRFIILSHGSFSAIIGYLGFLSTVYYPPHGHRWYGDMFSIDGWKEIK
jgi:hypothetical protein